MNSVWITSIICATVFLVAELVCSVIREKIKM